MPLESATRAVDDDLGKWPAVHCRDLELMRPQHPCFKGRVLAFVSSK